MIVDKTGELHKSSHSQIFSKQMFLKIAWESATSLKRDSNTKFFIKFLYQKEAPLNIAKFLRTAFFMELFLWLLLVTPISRRYFEMTASKFQGQHAAQRKILEQLLSKLIFWEGWFWKKKKKKNRGGEVRAVTLVFSSFHFFPVQLFIKSWNNVLSPQTLI